jgi:hypothetical protein
MAAHLNINSLRYKFDEIKEVLTDNFVDLLIISETKLDESFNDNLFFVIITSTSDGIQPFLKQVGPLTSCDRLKISQKSFKVALLSELSMSKSRSPNNNICSYSDCHNIISTVIKGEVLHEPKKLRYYRSYKTFDIENFNNDIEQIT